MAISGKNLVEKTDLPSAVCAIQFKNYKFRSKTRKQISPLLPKNPCTASFLNDRFLLTARHCFKESEVFFGSKEPQKLLSEQIDILCLKTKELGRNRRVKRIYSPPSGLHAPSMDVGYKELLLVELGEIFSAKIQPLSVSETPEILDSAVSVYGYGRTDRLEGGIENNLEPFLQFDDPRDQAMYSRSMSGIYKGAIVKYFEFIGIPGITDFYKRFGLSQATAASLNLGAALDRSSSPIRFLRLNYGENIDINSDNTPIKGGDSGGPVLNDRGEIVAVNSFAPMAGDASKRVAGFSTFLTEDLRHWINSVIR